ncbi:GLPGLI family protein [Aquimarina hainanensis]|uniref:GLPGLI family protein n=1 Tax=Aquimarina hainanensis TaxID=1578017 RepID=A0ABW5N1B5_9FLAO|nr:GLPGLI family protein [Aquimarina sp. TRL1]QKX04500.1 GLPGLI family protein [Aquimarina sp. TRL1]
MKTVQLFFLLLSIQLLAQNKEPQMMKVTYKSVPFSQYRVDTDDSRPEEEKNLDRALSYGYKYYYNLTLDLKSNKSIYTFDTLVVDKPKGREEYWLDPEDKLHYTARKNPMEYIKKEEIFQRVFYTTGNIGDIKWNITNETKNIMGFECIKATSKKEEFLITVWFTKEIPVISGPSNYFGLPGMVLWAEDFFRTISAEKIEYIKDPNFEDTYKSVLDKFENDKGENETKEIIFLIKKAQLVKSMRSHI